MLKIYSIYDKVAKKFNAPFLAENNDVANRSFQLSLKNNPFSEDFDLYYIGEFKLDSETILSPICKAEICLVSHYIGEVVDNG